MTVLLPIQMSIYGISLGLCFGSLCSIPPVTDLDAQTVLIPGDFHHCFTLQVKVKDLQKLDQPDAQMGGLHVTHMPHNFQINCQLNYQCQLEPTLSVLQTMLMPIFDKQKGKEVGTKGQSEIFSLGNNIIPL